MRTVEVRLDCVEAPAIMQEMRLWLDEQQVAPSRFSCSETGGCLIVATEFHMDEPQKRLPIVSPAAFGRTRPAWGEHRRKRQIATSGLKRAIATATPTHGRRGSVDACPVNSPFRVMTYASLCPNWPLANARSSASQSSRMRKGLWRSCKP